jgi:mannobiose 2-epimerase
MDKHWWPQAEAVVGYLNAYQISNDEKFLDTALNSWKFIQNYIVDKENGEWHWSVNKDGKPSVNNEKAGFWKCPYHNGRACMEVITRVG